MQYPPQVDPQAPWLFKLGQLTEVERRLQEACTATGATVEPLSEFIGAKLSGLSLKDMTPLAVRTHKHPSHHLISRDET